MTIYLCVVALIIISILVTLYIMVVTLWRCRSEKRYNFMLCMISVFLYLTGSLLEISSFSADGALAAMKITYLGGCFLPAFYLFFVADYCDAGAAKRLWPLILAPPVISLPIVWTTEYHGMMYASYYYDASAAIPGLRVEEGVLNYWIYCYILLYALIDAALLIKTLMKRRERFKFFMLLIAALAAPVFAVGAHVLCSDVFRNALGDVNFMPFALVVTNVLFYAGVVRYDLFDIAPAAYSMTLDYIRDAFVLVSDDMKYLSSNKAARRLFPGLEGLRRGLSVTLVENWPEELLNMDGYAEGFGASFVTPDGEGGDRYFSAQIDDIYAGGKARPLGRIILIQDVTSSVTLMKKLEQAAYTDVLTGLYNRRHFMELAAMQFDRAKRSDSECHVMMLDLDFFKNVNDTYGHMAGDEVLRRVSAYIKDVVRSYDLVARYGGEEFVVMVSDSDDETAMRLAERVRAYVEANPCPCGERSLAITFSVGVASGRETASFEDLLRHADEAMYMAKKSGRNRVVLYGAGSAGASVS